MPISRLTISHALYKYKIVCYVPKLIDCKMCMQLAGNAPSRGANGIVQRARIEKAAGKTMQIRRYWTTTEHQMLMFLPFEKPLQAMCFQLPWYAMPHGSHA